MAGRLGGSLLLCPTSTVNNISCKNLNPCSASQAFSLCPTVFSLKFRMFSIFRNSKFTLRHFNPSSGKNNSVVLGTRNYSGRSIRSERDRDNEPLSTWRKAPRTTDFNTRSTNRRDTQSKSLVEEELDMDSLFGKRGASMSGRSNPGRNDYNDGSSRNSRGNGVSARGRRGGGRSSNWVSARGRRGEGDLSNRIGSYSSGRQALKSSDDEDEDESEDDEDETPSSLRNPSITKNFSKTSTNRRDIQSKRSAEEELDMDNWFDKRGISMSGQPKRGRNDDNHAFSRNSRGNGVSARGRRGEGDSLNIRGSKSSGMQALKISDDEDEDESESEDEDDEFDDTVDGTSSSDDEDEFESVKPVGHKQPILSTVEKEDPKKSSVKATGDANYLSQSR